MCLKIHYDGIVDNNLVLVINYFKLNSNESPQHSVNFGEEIKIEDLQQILSTE